MIKEFVFEDKRKIIQECPFCGNITYGIGPLRKHMKMCKKKLCAQCKRPREFCTEIMKNWMVECGEKFINL